MRVRSWLVIHLSRRCTVWREAAGVLNRAAADPTMTKYDSRRAVPSPWVTWRSMGVLGVSPDEVENLIQFGSFSPPPSRNQATSS